MAEFDVTFLAFTEQNDYITYSSADGKIQVVEHMKVDAANQYIWYNESPDNSGAWLTALGPDTTLDTGIELAGYQPVVNYDGTNAQQEADELKWLCTDPVAYATCSFDATSETKVGGAKHQVGDSFTNSSSVSADYTLAEKDMVSSSNSVDITATASAEFFELFDASISAKYGHTWTNTHEFDEQMVAHVPPGVTVWLDDAPQMIRDTGNFHITIGDTTVNLNNVYFDSPDPSGAGNWSLESKPPGAATPVK
jgi:hypothetical protein